jgi:hypothetical protein
VVSATVLALGLAVGLVGWQVARHGRSSGQSTAIMQALPSRGGHAETIPVVSGDSLASAAGVRVVRLVQTPRLVLVGSAEQASQVQDDLDAAEAIRHQWALPPLAAEVAQLDAGPAVATRQAVEDLNVVRVTLGIPAIQVVDLRTAPTTTEPASQSVATSSTAAQARQAIADENQLRASLGLPELPAPE